MARTRIDTVELWANSPSPELLLAFLAAHRKLSRVKGHRRKLRLLCCAAARIHWDRLPNDQIRDVIIAAERHADTEIRRVALRSARDQASDPQVESISGLLGDAVQNILSFFGLSSPQWNQSRELLTLLDCLSSAQVGLRRARLGLASSARLAVAYNGDRFNQEIWQQARAHHAEAIRDLFGDPFAPVVFEGSWNTLAVHKLARAIHSRHAFGDLPILADALEEAGCAAMPVLEHCRGPGPHVRGCWVIDGILGRGIAWK